MPQEQFTSGAVRGASVAGAAKDKAQPRFDLISPIALRRLAETYGEGSVKYGDVNWRKGMPFTTTANHAIAHVVEYLRGDTSEDHLAHAAWGLFALMHFESTHPELNDIKRDDYDQNNDIEITGEALRTFFRTEVDGTSATEPHLPSRSEVERTLIPPPSGFNAGSIEYRGEY